MGDLTRGRILARLLALQACWSYDRMQGIGLAWAAEPGLRRVLSGDDGRYREAVARSAMFFNANPYLAPVAVGAEIRAEADRVPGPQIERLRTALCGSLGALGDRLFWAGIAPAFGAGAVLGIALGGGLWPPLVAVLLYNVIRMSLARRLLDLGWKNGLAVGSALAASPLATLGDAAVRAATVLGSAAVPVATAWLLQGASAGDVAAVLLFLGSALLLRRLLGPRASPRRLTAIGVAAVVVWYFLVPG